MKNSPEKVWKNCLDFIKDNISEQSFKTWFIPIQPIKLKGKTLNIQVPSKFFYEWIEEHYIKLLKTAISRELGEDAKLLYSIVMENTFGNSNPYTVKIPSNNRPPIINPKVSVPFEIAGTGVKNPFIIPVLKKVNVESQLNPNYIF
jgi:chromosomal replication initiator protein